VAGAGFAWIAGPPDQRVDEFAAAAESCSNCPCDQFEERIMPGPLSNAYTVTKLPAQDLERARVFYRDELGLEPVEKRAGGLRYVCGPTEVHLFSSAGGPSAESTQMAW
jgi:hypothetical protein